MCPEGTSGARQTFQSCALSSVVAPSASDYVDCPCGSVARIGVVADKVVGVDGGRSFLRELTFDHNALCRCVEHTPSRVL